ncbi:phage minor head protein [Streptococcus sp. VTCC 12886]|uniref:phage minor head protein n=1 Tax=Streptococcus sp. VTCC 12886 TaxID=3413767 RepID=UPI003D9C7311
MQKADKATDKRLYNLYIDTIKDLKKSLLVDYQRLDNLTSSQKVKLSQMSTLLEQLDQSADKLKKGLRSEITGHLIDTGKIAYNELFYEFEGGHGGINFAMLKEEELRTIIETPVANFKLSERLNDGVVERLRNNIKDDLNRIFLHGASYAQASARLAEQGYSSYRRAMTITRTEAGRVQAVTREKAQLEARNLGIEFDKVWVATLDGRTRHNHAELDGAKADKDGYFEINGLRTKQPHMFGFASEDVNCRCRTISRLKDDDTLLSRRDNETGKIIEYRNYREWARAKGCEIPKKPNKKIVKVKQAENKTSETVTYSFENHKDAEVHAMANGVQYADFSKMKPEWYNAILKHLDKLPIDARPVVLTDTRTLQRLTERNLGRSAKSYYGITQYMSGELRKIDGELVQFRDGSWVGFNSVSFKTLDAMEKAKASIEKAYFEKTGKNWSLLKTADDTIAHEFGHVLDNYKNASDNWQWKNIAKQWYNESESDHLKIPSEAWADAVGLKWNGLAVPDYVEEYMEKYSIDNFNNKNLFKSTTS